MASTSTSSVQKSFKYDVFLSFRGEDTRKGFVGHLYDALQRQSINTYKDDEKITKGNKISAELMGSIKDSRFYIIVFSKDYASSSWCLDELVEIMKCQETSDQRAYPVFYDVEPTEVRKQIGLVGKAFSKHEKDKAAGKWIEALEGAAGLAGWDLNTFDGNEAKLIRKIVQEISLELRFIDSSVDEKLVGMENRVKDFVSTLETVSDDVRMIGIRGMGGAGKTTLARAIFDHISSWFEGKSFVANVREFSKASLSGLKELQEQILSDVLNDPKIKISNVHDGKQQMKKRMRGQKVVLVLDDVDHVEQLQALAGEPDWFKAGSIIIITTRDEQVLVAHRAVNKIDNVNLLSDEEAIRLFSRYAFGKEIPIQGYEELSGNVVRYAAGLPLTITVLGSFLCGKTDLQWISALERLKTIPLIDTLKKLELSYIGLEADYKEIFLDVACILKGWETEQAIEALESCGFHARIGLRVLEQRSLITISISEYGSYLGMHDHIEEMGKNIVRRLHSRLWIPEEIEDTLTNDSGNYDAIQCIRWRIQRNWFSNETYLRDLRNMKKLRFLDIDGGVGVAILPNALRYLKWREYPSQSLIKSFQADNLVGLSMPDSRITQFWKSGERKVLPKLRFLDICCSDLRTFDLEMTPNIEKLNLAYCHHLVELKMPLGCSKLKALDLRKSGLRNLNLAPTPNLKTLDLQGCKDLAELTMPYQCPKLKVLYLRDLKLMTLNLPHLNLEILSLENCDCLEELHMPNECPKLKHLNLKNSALRNLNLGSTPDLEILNLEGCGDLVELHVPNECPKFKHLNLKNSALRNLNLGSTPDLEILNVEGCRDLAELHMSNEFTKLKHLNLENSALRNLNLGSTPDLEILSLEGCRDLVELHMPNECRKLKHLNLKNSALRSLNLGSTPDLEILNLEGCRDLVELHMPNEYPQLKHLNLENLALRNLNLGSTPNLEILNLEGCRDLVELHMPNECPKLKHLNLENSALRNLNLGMTPDLEILSLEGCRDLVKLHMPNECPKLKHLNLKKSALRNLNLGSTPDLEILSLEGCRDLVKLHMPNECPKLKHLNLKNSALRNLNLGSTPDLKDLNLEGCRDLVELHMPFQCSKLKQLNIKNSALRNLNLGSTPDLEILNLEGCRDLVEFHMPFQYPKLKVLRLEGSELRTLYRVHTPDLETPSLERCCQLSELHMRNECRKLKSLSINDSQLKSLNLGVTPNLERLNITECFNLVELHAPIECFKRFLIYEQIQSPVGSVHVIAKSIDTCPMHSDSNLPKFQFSCLYEKSIFSPIGNLGKFISIGLSPFTNLESFSSSVCDLQGLRKLTLEGSIPEAPKDLDRLQGLEELSLLSATIKHLPDSICMLKHLKLLELNSCLFIEKLPEGLGRLECLEDLNLTLCIRLQDIPKSICDMKRLKCINLSSCLQVKKLPRELRRLECLKELNIKDTGISDLPDGIFELEGLYIVASDGFSCTVEQL